MTKDPITLEMLQDMLGLVMTTKDLPEEKQLEKLTQEEREEIAKWVGDCHFEASDNEVHAGPMPPVLRDKLSEDHTYKTWRVG